MNTEELVRSFYNEIDPEVLAIEELMTTIVNDEEAEDKSAQLNAVVAKIQQLQVLLVLLIFQNFLMKKYFSGQSFGCWNISTILRQ